jgi:C1A family cysteine protease
MCFQQLKRVAHLLIVFCAFILSAAPVFASQQELDTVKKSINYHRAHWVAEETSVSILPDEHRKGHLGLIKPHKDELGAVAPSSSGGEATAAGAPATFDWRNNNGYSFVTPVRNQGNCGSCWAFATTAALEANTLIVDNYPSYDLNIAEQVMVSCGGSGSCGGGYINKASDYIKNTGLPLESCDPYTATDSSCLDVCTDKDRISGWHWVTTTSPMVDAIIAALYTYGPLVTTMDVYSDFYYYKTGVYSYVSGTYQGGHAILIVGYDDVGGYFIAKNSWGTNWGESGYFRVAYSQVNSAVGFGEYTIAYESGSTPPPTPTCTYTLSGMNKPFTAQGGSASIGVTSASGCSWQAQSNASWIVITSGSAGSGNGTVTYFVAANTTTTSRTGTITIAGQTYTVKQSGKKTTGKK